MSENYLKDYETLFIVRPTLDEDTVDQVVASVEEYIRGQGGIVESTDKKGRRRLSYEFKKMRDGYYVLINFKGKAESIVAIKRMMTISEDVIRSIIVIRDEAATEARF